MSLTYTLTIDADNPFRTYRFFVNKSVPEVVTEVLQKHGLNVWECEYTFKADYPKREQINQYQAVNMNS